jgi:hypothetical protein
MMRFIYGLRALWFSVLHPATGCGRVDPKAYCAVMARKGGGHG